ncbi:hypothetical protein [Methylomonas sp. MgM2]
MAGRNTYRHFDDFPYDLLSIVPAIEAVLIAGFFVDQPKPSV